MAHRKWLYLISGVLLLLGCESKSGTDDCRAKLDSTVHALNARLDSTTEIIGMLLATNDSLEAEAGRLRDSLAELRKPKRVPAALGFREALGRPLPVHQPKQK